MHPIFIELSEKYIGPRVYVRPMQKGDGEGFYKLLQENHNHLLNYVEEVKTITSIEKAEIRSRKLHGDWHNRARFVLGIFLNENDNMIGELWLEPINWEIGNIEIGYFIAKAHVGKGLVSESVKLALILIFKELGLAKAEIHVDSTNERSYSVAQRLHFKEEARIRKRVKHEDGEICDRLYYGLLKEEYEALDLSP